MATKSIIAQNSQISPTGVLRLTVTETSLDGLTNKSIVTCALDIYGNTLSANSSSPTYSFTVDGTTWNGTLNAPFSITGWKNLQTVTKEISHNSDGAKSISLSCSITFGYGWNGNYDSNNTMSASGTMVLTDVIHTVSYNANSGTEAPASQLKYWGHILTLSSVYPTKEGYKFLGWGSSPTAVSPSYQPGGQYGLDEDITLYAIWELNDVDVDVEFTPFDSYYFSLKQFSDGYYAVGTDSTDNTWYLTTQVVTSGTIESCKYRTFYVDGLSGTALNIDKNVESTWHGVTWESNTNYSMTIPYNTIVKSILNFKNETKTIIGIQFDLVINGVNKILDYYVEFPLIAFNFLNVNMKKAYRTSSTNAHIELNLLLPKNSVPNATFQILYESSNALDLIEPSEVEYNSENSKMITLKFDIDSNWITSNAEIITFGFSDRMLSYISSVGDPSDFSYFIDIPISEYGNEDIFIYTENGNCEAVEFIESDEFEGFQKGGRVYAREFIESDSSFIDANNVNGDFYMTGFIER